MIARLRRRDEDEGAALLIVLAVAAVLAMLMTLLVGLSVNGMRQSHSDADWNAALAAAYAGVDEYQSRLSDDTSYYRYGNASAAFSATSTVSAPPVANPAFGVGPGGSWAAVAGSDGAAEFRYEVDNSLYPTTGRIRVRSTGKVGTATRTVIADLKQQGFIDFLYFTDYEVQDPSIATSTGSDCYNAGGALKYGWESRPVGSRCNDIAFAPNDTINGPVHSNDTIRACGTRFNGTVTTAKSTSPFSVNMDAGGSSCTAASFALAGYPSYSGGVIGMPATNSQLKRETRTDLGDDVPRPGCLYTGPTQFTFNAGGTVTIRSPFTKKTRTGDAASTTGSEPAECGTIAQLRSTSGATIAVPENNVLYVQNVPAVTSDVNYWAPSTNPANFTCTSTGTASGRGWTFGTGSYPPGYPSKTSSSSTTEAAQTGTTYGCRSGDVFVKGTFDGAATLAAENYVFVVGDLTYADRQDDILGLVGNNAVWVYNPVNSSNRLIDRSRNREIDAAILSVAHTFQVQNYGTDTTRGTLTVLGAIAQKYRGPVATGNASGTVTGYAKDYIYDERFKYKAPPKFLNPVTTTYGVTSWVETAAVFAADGSAR